MSNGIGSSPAINTYTQYDGFTKLLQAKYVGLICGQTYHIKLAIGNVSDNTLDSGVFLKNFSVAPPKLTYYGLDNDTDVCDGGPEPIKIDGDFPSDAIYSWTIDGVLQPETGSTILPSVSGLYCVTITTGLPSNCPIGSDCIDIKVLPKLDIVPPGNMSVCATTPPPFATPFYFNINQNVLMLSNVNAADYAVTYYNSSYQDAFDGVPTGKIPNADLANYPLKTASQTIWARIESLIGNACVNVENFTLEAIQSPEKPVATTTTQPTCSTPTGTIKVGSPLGATYEYSIDGGIKYQTNTEFSDLAQNASYTITVMDIVSKCVSLPSNPIVVNAVTEAPQNVQVNITQPTCPTPTGTIIFTSPVGANYEYSINGGSSYFASPNFSNLSPNNYSIVVLDINTGCSSSPQPYTIDAVPSNPAAPSTNVIQPDCVSTTGSVVITAPLGVDFEYSNGGVYQSNPDFANLSPSTSYNFTVRNKITECTSVPTIVTINAALNIPVAPTASVTFQPTCLIPTGTITVTAPLGGNLEYSKDGVNYQSGVIFNNLAQNTNYNITARDIVSGCISAMTVVFVNAIPGSPNAPQGTITQPNCNVNTGVITITSPLGSNLEYSKDGINFQSNTDFIDEIGLKEHLSPTRANGLVSMIKQIKMYALAFQAKQTN